MEFQCRVIVQRRCTSCCSSVENIPLQAERPSARSQKLFAFPPESAFTFRPECCSESQRNGVRLHSGISFTFDRIPHEERWVGPDDMGEPLACAFGPLLEALELAAYPLPQMEVDSAQTVLHRRFVEVTIVVVVLQVSNADKFVAEGLSCLLRLPNRKGCRLTESDEGDHLLGS